MSRSHQIIQSRLCLLGWQCRQSATGTHEIPESRIVLTFVADYLFKNCDAGLIPKRLELLSILRYNSALVDLKSSKCEIWAADTMSERVRMTERIARVFWLDSAEFLDPSGPQLCMVLLRRRQPSESIPAMWVRFTLGESCISMETFHLRLPVASNAERSRLLSEAAMVFSVLGVWALREREDHVRQPD
jgi:hypothetical protein